MDAIDRRIVECIKAARGVKLTINPDDPANRLTVTLGADKRLSHDIGLAVQTYFNNQYKPLKTQQQ